MERLASTPGVMLKGLEFFFFFQLFLVFLGDISNIGRDESRREREKEGRREGDRKRERD